MVFSKRDIEEIGSAGFDTKTFFLRSRTRPLLLIREWFRLKQELRVFDPDIVHAQYGTMTAFMTVLAAARLPTAVTFHNAELQSERRISVIREKAGHILSQLAALRANRIVCVSEELKGRLWWSRDRVFVIPSSVSLERFRPQQREEARAALGWDRDKLVVLFYKGRNPETKRLDRALATIEIARKILGPMGLEVLGSSEDPNRIPLYLNAADCLLCTSDSEGSPTIVKEAMACNLPVVSVDVGDVRRRLEGVQNCFIRKRDPDDLAAALVSVLRSGRRSDGRLHVADVTNHVCRERLLEMYRQMLKEPSPDSSRRALQYF